MLSHERRAPIRPHKPLNDINAMSVPSSKHRHATLPRVQLIPHGGFHTDSSAYGSHTLIRHPLNGASVLSGWKHGKGGHGTDSHRAFLSPWS
ncbi:Hepatocyte growth factor receptor [Clarias magur]|uniref:Hepatocyte growth factor receptor n=1 Tax=Clarias magur TaxID=1594786 RepID=A0A8J4X8N4_CLAMG|nr:Hepatocyte growth factor receptor [Clarias magur]